MKIIPLLTPIYFLVGLCLQCHAEQINLPAEIVWTVTTNTSVFPKMEGRLDQRGDISYPYSVNVGEDSYSTIQSNRVMRFEINGEKEIILEQIPFKQIHQSIRKHEVGVTNVIEGSEVFTDGFVTISGSQSSLIIGVQHEDEKRK